MDKHEMEQSQMVLLPLEISIKIMKQLTPEAQALLGMSCLHFYDMYSNDRNSILAWELRTHYIKSDHYKKNRKPFNGSQLETRRWKTICHEGVEIIKAGMDKMSLEAFQWAISKKYIKIGGSGTVTRATFDWETTFPKRLLFIHNRYDLMAWFYSKYILLYEKDILRIPYKDCFREDNIETWEVYVNEILNNEKQVVDIVLLNRLFEEFSEISDKVSDMICRKVQERGFDVVIQMCNDGKSFCYCIMGSF